MESVKLTSYRTATTLEASIGISAGGLVSIAVMLGGYAVTAAAESALVSQGNVVRSCASLLSPRHDGKWMVVCERNVCEGRRRRVDDSIFLMCLAR
jgi:hypothetical protein